MGKQYAAHDLTGGATGALDAIDGTLLANNDLAVAINDIYGIIPYYLSATSGAAEDSPNVIAPDTNAGNKRWLKAASVPSYEVDALVYAPNTFTQASIEAALIAIKTPALGGLNCTLLLRPGTWVISSNANWSAYTNVTFKIVPGTVISHGAFTVNIPNIDAGLYQIFSGAGLVTLSGNVKEAYPEWFATNTAPGTTDMAAAINAALLSRTGAIVKLNLPYALASTINLQPHAQLIGNGSDKFLYPAAGIAAITITNPSPEHDEIYTIKQIGISGGKNGISIVGGGLSHVLLHSDISNLYITGTSAEAILVNGAMLQGFKWSNVVIKGGTYGIRIINAYCNVATFDTLEIRETTVAGFSIVGDSATYTTPVDITLLNCSIEGNLGVGINLHGVHGFHMIGGDLEGNSITAGTRTDVTISGATGQDVARQITFDHTWFSSADATDATRILVTTNFVSGPIIFKNVVWGAGAEVDFGAFAYTPTYIIEGVSPHIITGGTPFPQINSTGTAFEQLSTFTYIHTITAGEDAADALDIITAAIPLADVRSLTVGVHDNANIFIGLLAGWVVSYNFTAVGNVHVILGVSAVAGHKIVVKVTAVTAAP